MPSISETTRIAASGSQPPFCSWARHNNGMIADCWRPAGYFVICCFAHAAFSAVKENSFGCWSGGARRRLAMSIVSLDGPAARRLAGLNLHRAPDQNLARRRRFLQDELQERIADL